MMRTSGFAQETALSLEGQRFLMRQKDTGCARRTVADVPAVADPNTGVAVFGPSSRGNRSAWLVFGGTSIAAPLIAGLYGVNDTAVNHGSDSYRHTANLHDVRREVTVSATWRACALQWRAMTARRDWVRRTTSWLSVSKPTT
jgi:hypothetical protein